MNQSKPELTVTEKLFIILAWKCNGMSMAAAYENWSNDFARKSNLEYYKDSTRQLQGWKFRIDDLQQVNPVDLWHMGFRDWDGEGNMLLPLWLVPHMEHEEGWQDLHLRPKELTAETDLDVRGGCIALSFKHVPVDPPTESLDDLFDDGLGAPPPLMVNVPEDDPDLRAFVEGMPGGGNDEVTLVHPLRDDEHQ